MKLKNWTKIQDASILSLALKQARGAYQRNILNGWENLSGSTLRGNARFWGLQYKISRQNLLARLTKNNLPWHEEKDGSRRILVLG